MFENQFKINFITSKCKCLEEKTNCKMSTTDSKNNCNNCNCNCNALNIRMNNYVNILNIVIIFMVTLMIVIFIHARTCNAESKLYFERASYMLKGQEQALQIAQEELSGLKIQMQYVLQSIRKNRISNHSQRRSAYHYNSSSSMKSITHNFSNSSPGRYKRDAEISTLKSYYDTTISILPFAPNQIMNDQKNMLEENINNISNNITISSEKFGSKSTVNLTNTAQNLPRDRKHANVKTQNRKTREDYMNDSGAFQNSRRNQRREKKKNRKGKRRHNREKSNHNYTQSGPLVATFVGASPNYQSTEPGYIKWNYLNQTNRQFEFKKFYLTDYMIEINQNGLYMIFTQIFYDGSAINHAYFILLMSEGADNVRQLSKCAVASAAAGASCHTSVIAYLQKTDRLIIKQDQSNRHINLKLGYSQVQLVLLSEETSNVE